MAAPLNYRVSYDIEVTWPDLSSEFLNENRGRDTLFHAQTELLYTPAALSPNREEEEKKRKGENPLYNLVAQSTPKFWVTKIQYM